MGMPRRITRALLTTLWFLTQFSLADSAAGAIQFPLDGYFRPGRCMPVVVPANSGPWTFHGDGMVPTVVPAGYGGVIPVLILQAPADSAPQQTSFRSLAPNERLVGIVGSDQTGIDSLFPGERPV